VKQSVSTVYTQHLPRSVSGLWPLFGYQSRMAAQAPPKQPPSFQVELHVAETTASKSGETDARGRRRSARLEATYPYRSNGDTPTVGGVYRPISLFSMPEIGRFRPTCPCRRTRISAAEALRLPSVEYRHRPWNVQRGRRFNNDRSRRTLRMVRQLYSGVDPEYTR
jgi:hypothetical protein